MKKISVFLIPVFLLSFSCEKECFQSDRCRMSPDIGPCEALIPKYHYSAAKGKCETFMWGGCDGTVPFEDLESCRDSCICNEK